MIPKNANEIIKNLIDRWNLPTEEAPKKDGDVSYYATVSSNEKNPFLIIKFFTGESEKTSQINGSVGYDRKLRTYRPYIMDLIAGERDFFRLTADRDEAINIVRKMMQNLYTSDKINPEKIREILWEALNSSRKIRIVFKEDADASYVANNLVDMCNSPDGIILLDEELLKTMMIARVSERWGDDKDRIIHLMLNDNFVSYNGMMRFVLALVDDIERIEVVPNENIAQ